MKTRFLAFSLALLMVFGLSGCTEKDPSNPKDPENSGVTENDELVLYHNTDAFTDSLTSLAKRYTDSTGKKLSAGYTKAPLWEEAEKRQSSFFLVDAHDDLSPYYEKNAFTDLSTDSRFLSTKLSIPDGLSLTNGKPGSYGVPLMLEAYGYLFDKETLKSLFEVENVEALIDDLAQCSYTEFEGFVAAVDTYIKAPTAAKVTLSGTTYTFAAEKSPRASRLTGVFALSAESTRAAEALFGTLLASQFKDKNAVQNADSNTVSALKERLPAFMDVLDLHTGYIAGKDGTVGRGDAFTGGDFSYTAAIDLFTNGYALFYPGSTADTADFEKSSAGFGENLAIIPMKLPLSDKDIKTAGLSAEKLQRSILVGARYYLALNPNAPETARSEMTSFLRWLYGEKDGAEAYMATFDGLPFNYTVEDTPNLAKSDRDQSSGSSHPDGSSETETKPGETTETPVKPQANYTLKSSLMESVARYYAKGDWIPVMTGALPNGWTADVLGKNLTEYWGKEVWSDDDVTTLADRLVTGWNDLMKK